MVCIKLYLQLGLVFNVRDRARFSFRVEDVGEGKSLGIEIESVFGVGFA